MTVKVNNILDQHSESINIQLLLLPLVESSLNILHVLHHVTPYHIVAF